VGFASKLLQVNLGVGLITAACSAAATSCPSSGKTLAQLRRAAEISSPALLLAVFALIQARGSAVDLLSWAGLFASTVSVVLGTVVSALWPVLGAGVAETNGNAELDADLHSYGASRGARAVSSLRALGQTSLIVSCLPASLQLSCASVLVRLALLSDTLGAFAHAMAIKPGTSRLLAAQQDAERMLTLAPVLGALALLDHIAWGSAPPISAPVQPILYCTVACLILVNLVFLMRKCFDCGVVDCPRSAEFDIRFGGADHGSSLHVEPFRQLTVLILYAALVLSGFRVFTGFFTVEISTTGFAISWAEPFVATAALLSSLCTTVYLGDYVSAQLFEKPLVNDQVATTNGDAEAEVRIMEKMKAITMPTQGITLALIATHVTTTSYVKLDPLDAMLFSLPLKYGFLLTAAAVFLQVAVLMVFVAFSGGTTPSFDGIGTAKLDIGSKGDNTAAMFLQVTAVFLLEGGLFLGMASLGVSLWLLVSLPVVPFVVLFMPPEFFQGLWSTLRFCFSVVLKVLSTMWSWIDSVITQRRLAQEAASAQQAKEKAARLEAEIAAQATTQAPSKASNNSGPASKVPFKKGKKKF